MTAFELVGRHFPSADAEQRPVILWSCTAYPFCSLDQAEEQLREAAVRSSSPEHAIEHAHAEMDAAMAAAKQEVAA